VSFLLHVLAAVVLMGLVVGLGVVVTFYVLRRRLRRSWNRVSGHVVTRAVLAAPSVLAAWRDRFEGRAGSEALPAGSPPRARRQMWLAIEDAERAVHQADALNAPVAELPAVCRALRRAGEELDHLMRAGRRLPADRHRTDAVPRQVAELMHAARDVQAAAVCAGSEATEPRLRALVRDARDEVQIVAAALNRMRSVASP
jgi:hypothetical protein